MYNWHTYCASDQIINVYKCMQVGMGRSGHQVVQARADEGVLQRSAALHHHHQQQNHVVDQHDHQRRHHHYAGLQQEQQRAAVAAAVFHVSTPTDPIAALIAAPRAHQGSVLLTAPAAEPYDHGAASYHHQQVASSANNSLDAVLGRCI